MNHARQADCEVAITCRSDGTMLGLRGEVFVDLGAYVRTNGLIAPTERSTEDRQQFLDQIKPPPRIAPLLNYTFAPMAGPD
jgi:hypothetical protein